MRIVASVIVIWIWGVSSAAQAAAPYPIDVIVSLTGPGAFLAQGEQDALVLAEHAIDDGGGIAGRPVKFIYHDDQSNPQTAVQLATQVVAGRPAVVLGNRL